MVYILDSYSLDGTNLQILKASEDFETIAEASTDLGFDVSNLTSGLHGQLTLVIVSRIVCFRCPGLENLSN